MPPGEQNSGHMADHHSPSRPERVVSFRPQSILQVSAVLLGVAIALWIVFVARQVITWVFVAMFLTLALAPAVSMLQLRGIRRRGAATAVVLLVAVILVAGVGALLLPPLVDQVSGFADAAPGYVHDLTRGRGPLGFLERNYHIVERVREAASNGGGSGITGGASTLLSLTRGVVTAVVGVVTIIFLTIFMLLEGPTWWERGLGMLPAERRPRWRNVGRQIGQTVSGYLTGNLVISLIAGTLSAIVLLIMGVPFPLALGLLVAILDLIPLAGATIAGLVLAIVGFLTSIVAGVVVLGFFILYQQAENHILQPLVYGRTVQLSPLVVLISILVASEVAGVLGALAAIPVAGTLQILLLDWLRHRRRERSDDEEEQTTAVAAEAVDLEQAAPT
jgi:predicted PurR-regulated permease PerM